MNISKLASQIAESPTLKLSETAGILRSKGEPVINLGVGEPKNKAPQDAIYKAATKLTAGMIKYGPVSGMSSLKKAIIQYTEENYRKSVAPENVIVTNGAKHSLFNSLFTLIDPMDEVIIFAPYWVSYPEIIKMVSGKPVVVTPNAGEYVPSIENVVRSITSATKAIILNSPNNPSGMVFPEDFVAEIVDLCEIRGIYLIMDDIYQKFVFDNIEAPVVYDFTKNDLENSKIIVVNGISKLYGMTGFRIGWTIASKSLIKTMSNIQGLTTSCPSIISQAGAEGALLGDQSDFYSLQRHIEENRDVLIEEIAFLEKVSLEKPQGTFYAFPDFSAYNQNSADLANFILEKALVVTIPGSAFGMEGHLRISYSGSTDEVEDGIRRIRWALDKDSPKEIYIGDKKQIRTW